jgi:hypothetical protein
MKCLMLLLFFGLSFSLLAQEHLAKELERINFFPKAPAYLLTNYSHQQLHIETPQESLNTKSVVNISNTLELTYAQKVARKLFLGINLSIEEASENGVKYGVPLRRRFSSFGLREPELFATYRLKHQQVDQGLIDLHLAFSPAWGQREIGNENANRLNGRNVSKLGLSHGFWEEAWEFQTLLGLTYFDEGEEQNHFSDRTYDLRSQLDVKLKFTSQYRLTPWWFLYVEVGIVYAGSQVVAERGGMKREIKAGTGSEFQVGAKYVLDSWSLVELNYTLFRYDYFVKSQDANLEGDAVENRVGLAYKRAF